MWFAYRSSKIWVVLVGDNGNFCTTHLNSARLGDAFFGYWSSPRNWIVYGSCSSFIPTASDVVNINFHLAYGEGLHKLAFLHAFSGPHFSEKSFFDSEVSTWAVALQSWFFFIPRKLTSAMTLKEVHKLCWTLKLHMYSEAKLELI